MKNNKLIGLSFLALVTIVHPNAQAKMDSAPEFNMSEITGSFPYIEIERNMSKMDGAFYDASPENLKDGLAVGRLKNKSAIMDLAREIADGKHAAYDSLLIAHNDKLVFESYFSYGRVNLPHYQASATKGYTSLAIGRAIQMGYLSMEDLHKPVLEFLSEVDKKTLVAGAKKVTLDHTLSMRSGLRIDDERQDKLLKNTEAVKGQKLAQVYLTHSSPVTDESQVYHYQPMDTRISMMVLDAVVPGSAKDFIKTELLNKLGITQYRWDESVNGLPEAAHSTSMKSRDMITWGRLLKDQGMWKGEQLISRDFLNQATGSIATPTDEDFDYSDYRYGYYFWGKKLKVGDAEYDAKMAWGGGTQMVISLAELDLVIAVTARARSAGSEMLELLESRVLPAFVEGKG